jgi:hypothetical protein
VATSRDLIGGSEVEIANLIVFNQFDQAYQQLRQGQTVDWQALRTEGVKFGYVEKDSLWEEIQDHLTRPFAVDENFEKQFKKDRGLVLRHLLMEFCRTMRDQHGMSFVCSRVLWQAILDALDAQEIPAKQRKVPNGYFAIQQPKLDRYVAQLLGGFLSMQQAKGLAIVWGMPLLYEFLLERNIISAHVAEKAIATAQEFKPQLVKGLKKQLWQYDFVHRWPRPDYVSEEDFTAEAEQFRATMTQSTPLSDEPNPSPFPWLRDIPDLPKEDLTQSANSTPSEEKPAQPAAVPPQPQRTWKSPKPKQSPLQEAKALGQAKSKKSKKKKSGGGFN